MEEREKLKSRLGFILLSAGCAIGIGNVWKFPYTAGQGGGGAFVLFYLLFLIILGLPIMTMEFAVGRASQKSPVKAYHALEKPGQKWHIHGIITLIGCYLLMMFYTTVTGWMLHYFYMTVTGQFQGLDADGVSGQFTTMLSKPLTMGFWMVVVVAIGIFVCARGLQNGLEKVTKVMMIALLVIMVVLAVNSMFMPGAKEGLSFFLVPDFGRMKEVGVVNTLVSAFEPGTDTELPIGQRGELCISGPCLMKGYYNMPDHTAKAISPDGWLHSGDLGVMDENGYLRVTGRIKDMIIRGGENIYPRELEEFLYHFPGVKDVQVAAVPSKKYGEEVGAFIILHDGVTATEEEVKDFCRGKIARHKIPKYIFFVDTFPMTGSGKIQKFKLKDLGLKLLQEQGITPA